MQPYFLPYVGYFQLIDAVDLFILYDSVKYTKKGWINRNRFLQNGSAAVFSIPLRAGSDALEIRERRIADAFDRRKLLGQLSAAYRKAPNFDALIPLVREILYFPADNLFEFLRNSVQRVCDYLGLRTRIVASSSVPTEAGLRGQERVIALARAVGGTHYINPPGGVALYEKEVFSQHGLELSFLQPGAVVYSQYGLPFVPNLSILDVMMFNNVPETIRLLTLRTLS